MATEGRAPEDLQEAVAATLRRLRGELGTPGQSPAARQEPALGSTLAGPTAPSVATQPAASPPPAPVQPDLLSRAETEHEIPPNPSARLAELRQTLSRPDPADRPRPRLLPYMLSILAVAVFAGIGWWAYKSINAVPRNGEVPVVAASQTPEKVPPPADQTADTTNTSSNKTIYNEVAPGSAPEPKTEVLLPPPEAPQLPATTDTTTGAITSTDTGSTAAATSATGTSASTDQTGSSSAGTSKTGTTTSAASSAAAPSTTTSTTTAPVTTQATTGASTAGGSSGLTETLIPSTSTSSGGAASTAPTPATTTASASTATTGQSAASTAAPSATTTSLPAAPLTVESTPPATTAPAGNANGSGATTAAAQPAAPATTAPASPTTTQTASLGNYRIQLASLKSEASAKKTWKRLATKYKDVLASLTVHIEKVALTSGTYYRLQAGPFADKASADAACAKLKALGQQCLVKP